MVPKKLKQSKKRSQEQERKNLKTDPTLMNRMSQRTSKKLSRAQRRIEAEGNETECQRQYHRLKATVKSKRRVKGQKKDRLFSLYTDNVTYIDDLHTAVRNLNQTKRIRATLQMFAMAKVTLETMQLQTLDDYILFFASANLLNNCAKDKKINGGYNFKQRIKYAIEAISYEHKYHPDGMIAQHTDFYSNDDQKGDCVYVRVCGVQFSFHRTMINIPATEYGYRKQSWSRIRLQPHAPKLFNYANHLSNLSINSWICDEETFVPLLLKEIQERAAESAYNTASPYHERPNDTRYTKLDSMWDSDKLLHNKSLMNKSTEQNTHIDINDAELDEYNDAELDEHNDLELVENNNPTLVEYNDDNVDIFDNYDII